MSGTKLYFSDTITSDSGTKLHFLDTVTSDSGTKLHFLDTVTSDSGTKLHFSDTVTSDSGTKLHFLDTIVVETVQQLMHLSDTDRTEIKGLGARRHIRLRDSQRPNGAPHSDIGSGGSKNRYSPGHSKQVTRASANPRHCQRDHRPKAQPLVQLSGLPRHPESRYGAPLTQILTLLVSDRTNRENKKMLLQSDKWVPMHRLMQKLLGQLRVET